MNKFLYYKMKKIRAMRRYLRRAANAAAKDCNAVRARVILKDAKGSNILKTKRCKGRILIYKII